MVIGRIRLAGVLVADVLDEQQDQDVVLVLAGVHAAAQFVAARPEGGVEFGFLEGHVRVFLSASCMSLFLQVLELEP